MGTSSASRQSQEVGPPIVAFDFDGTLTDRDSWTAFLHWRARGAAGAIGFARLAPHALAYHWDRDRAKLKAASARIFFRGVPIATAAAEALAHARQARILRPDALACWDDWGRQGARRVIVTASPELEVGPFARALGAERLIATRLALDENGRITGALDGPNCRGPVKVERLREAFGPSLRLAAAYGDSDGDEAMLAIADRPGMKVFQDAGQPAPDSLAARFT